MEVENLFWKADVVKELVTFTSMKPIKPETTFIAIEMGLCGKGSLLKRAKPARGKMVGKF